MEGEEGAVGGAGGAGLKSSSAVSSVDEGKLVMYGKIEVMLAGAASIHCARACHKPCQDEIRLCGP